MLPQADFANATLPTEGMPGKGKVLDGKIFLPRDFPELKLFALLKRRFGGPNGFVTFLLQRRQGDPDAPYKWDYVFAPYGNLKLQVVRGTQGIEVWWWGDKATEAER